MRSVEPSGFLGDYSQLTEGGKDRAALIYVNTAAHFARYDKLQIDPITIWLGDGSQFSDVSEAQLQGLADHLDAALEIGEGGRPSEEVAADLRSRLSDPSARVRRGVLSVLAHLRAPTDAASVIGLLEIEKDVTVRLAAIIALGELSNPQANPVLLAELQRNPSNPACKLEAARSLGRLNTKGSADDRDLSAVIAALNFEYDNSAPNSDLRAELIGTCAPTPALRRRASEVAWPHKLPPIRLRCSSAAVSFSRRAAQRAYGNSSPTSRLPSTTA